MTNIILNLILVTNWTGHIVADKELGYVATNHTLHVEYQKTTNDFVLKTTLSERARWRNMLVTTSNYTTNMWIWSYDTLTNGSR